MATRLATATQNAMAAAVTAAIDAGVGAGTVKVYTGGQPANANLAPTGTLLVTWTLADPSYGAPVAGVATLDATPVITAVAGNAGTAGWFRIESSTPGTVYDGLCGVGNQMVFDNPVLAAGQTVNLTAGTLTQPDQ